LSFPPPGEIVMTSGADIMILEHQLFTAGPPLAAAGDGRTTGSPIIRGQESGMEIENCSGWQRARVCVCACVYVCVYVCVCVE